MTLGQSTYERVGTLHPEQFGDGETFGGVMVQEVYECARCGALVIDSTVHDRWHTVNAIGLG